MFLRTRWGRQALQWLAIALCAFSTGAQSAPKATLVAPPARSRMPAPFGLPAVRAGVVYLASESGVEARRLSDASLVWRHPLTHYVPSALLVSDGIVLVAEQDAYALDADTGAEIWRKALPANASMGIAAVDAGTFFFGDAGHRVHAMQALDVKPRWERDIAPQAKYKTQITGVAIRDGRLFVSLEAWTDAEGRGSVSTLFCLDAASGRRRWSYPNDAAGTGNVQSSFIAPVALPNGRALVGDFAANTVTLLSSNGRPEWKFAGTKSYAGPLTRPAVVNGIVYVASGDRTFRRLSEKDGSVLGETVFSGSLSDFALCGSKAIVSLGWLEAVDLASGSRAAQSVLPAPHLVTSRLATDGAGGVLAMNAEGLYRVDCGLQ